jgi:hypothetical protein
MYQNMRSGRSPQVIGSDTEPPTYMAASVCTVLLQDTSVKPVCGAPAAPRPQQSTRTAASYDHGSRLACVSGGAVSA